MATINEEGLGIVWDQVNQLVAQETSDLVTNSTLDITVRHINEDINSAVAAAGDNPAFTGYMSLNRAENSTTGQKSVALGDANIASGTASMAEGLNSTASGNYAHAEGRGTTASGVSAHAEGTTSAASGDYSHAEGYGTTASGAYSHSEGNNSQSIGQYSHTEGYSTARSDYSHAEGDHTEVQANSYAAHAEGYTTSARAYAAHAEGGQTIASGQYSHSEGIQTTASANGSHAEGGNTAASAAQSHAEGSGTTASGAQSHAEGSGTTASGQYSHAEGVSTTASGTGSHAEGGGTIAASNVQHVQGQYNIEDNQNTYLDIVGNGSSASARSNAYTLDWSGNGVYAGKVTVGAAPTNNMDLTTKQYVDTAIAGISSDDTKVTQTATDSSSGEYELLFSSTADNIDRTEGARKTKCLTYIPQNQVLSVNNVTNPANDYIYLRADATGPRLGIFNNGSQTISLSKNDITLYGSGNTWDGTNTSLKDAIAAAGQSSGGTNTSFYDIIECTVSQLNSSNLPMYWHNPSVKYNGTTILTPTATELATLINASSKPVLLKVNISDTSSRTTVGGWDVPASSLYFPLQSCHVGIPMTQITFGTTGATEDHSLYYLQFDIHDNLDSQGQIEQTLSNTYYETYNLS